MYIVPDLVDDLTDLRIFTGDPWREATVAADDTTSLGSDLQPHLLGDGYHCSDMLISEGISSPAVLKVQNTVVEYLGKWLAEWKPSSA